MTVNTVVDIPILTRESLQMPTFCNTYIKLESNA